MRSASRIWLVLAITAASPAGAEVVVSNLPNAANDGYAVRGTQWLAQGFVTDAETRQLVSALVDVGNNFGVGGIVAELRTSDAGDPGVLVGTLSAAAPALTFLPAAPIELAPSTTYFLVLGFPLGNPNTMGAWRATADLSTSGVGSLTEARYSFDQGTSWDGTGITDQRLRLDVIAGAAPEPDATGLGVAALVALLGRRTTIRR